MSDVKEFIFSFTASEDIADAFSGENSYWFAVILHRKFIRDGAKIVCTRSQDRFATMIRGRVYDITGDVTSQSEWTDFVAIKT